MAQNSYALFKQSEVFYWFISTGPNGDIPKGVFLTPADVPAVSNPFNLGLADYVNDEWTDENITNNRDTSRIMETIASVIIDFMSKFPDRRIYVYDNTEAKRRLYQRYASNNLDRINKNYHLYGKEYGNQLF